MRAEVLRELARSRTPVDRLRTRTTAAATTGIGVAALAAASIAGLGTGDLQDAGFVRPSPTGGLDEFVPTQVGLAPFLAQAGLRPGAVLAAVLLVVPFAALAGQALRVGSLALEREAAQLALSGATPADLRRLRSTRTARAFGLGGVLAGPAYLLLWLLLGRALPVGSRLLPDLEVWMLLVWVALAVALALLGTAVGARRLAESAPLARATSANPPPPAGQVVLAAAAALLLPVAVYAAPLAADGVVPPAVLLLEALLLVTAVSGFVARRAARRAPLSGSAGDRADRRQGQAGRPAPRRLVSGRLSRDPAVAVLAAAQRRGSPKAAGAVAGVLFVCGLSFGVEAVLITDVLRPAGGLQQSELDFYIGGALLAGLVGLTAAIVALLALALSLTDHLLGARRAVASTAALGTDLPRLVAVQTRALRMTAVPATAAGSLLAGLLYAGPTLMGSPASGLRAAAASCAVAVLASLLVAIACRAVAGLLSGRVTSAAALENLRTP